MFDELGYVKGTFCGAICYKAGNNKEIHIVANKEKNYAYATAWVCDGLEVQEVGFSSSEIRAVAKLLDEMGL